MIINKTFFLLATILLGSSVLAANNYVSDNLYTYTHNGPGLKYKILGSVRAGEKIEIIKVDKNSGYTQIKDRRDRIVWMESKFVSSGLGLEKQLENLKIKYSKLDEKLKISKDTANEYTLGLEEKLNINTSEITELKNINSQVNKELKELQEVNNSLTAKLDNEKNELLMRWFSYGGIVAGSGLLIGLLIPSLIPSRKKKSRW